MFGTVLTVLVSLLHVYVFWRAGSVPLITAAIPKKRLYALGAGMWAVFFLGRLLGHGGAGPAAAVLESVGMNWMAALFLAAVALLAADLITAFGFLFSRQAAKVRGAALAAAAALSLFALFQGLRPPVVRPYEARLAGLPAALDGKTLVVVCDLHLGSLLGKAWLEALVARVQGQKPDLVLMLGDIFEGHGSPAEGFLSILRRLDAPLGVWGVLGNHESFRGSVPPSDRDAGFKLLRDSWVEVSPGLILAGVDSPSRHGEAADQGALTRALAGRPLGATILLSHTPENAEQAAAAGVGLMLCGHTHGGQVWPFGYLARLRYPLLAGEYRVGGMTVIVSRGSGTWGPRMRLWQPNEILRVTLRRQT